MAVAATPSPTPARLIFPYCQTYIRDVPKNRGVYQCVPGVYPPYVYHRASEGAGGNHP